MARHGGRKQAPGGRVGYSPGTRANDQAAQCSTREGTYNPGNGCSSTRDIMSGNDIPHDVEYAPTSLQQVPNDFLGPAPYEGHSLEQDDELFRQYTSDDPAWLMSHSGTQFTEDVSAADRHFVTESDPLGTNMSGEDVLTGDNAEKALEGSMDVDFRSTQHPNFLITNSVFAGNGNTPPWSSLGLHQFREDWGMSVDGSGPSTSRSTRIEGSPELSSVTLNRPRMSSMSSRSELAEDMAGFSLTTHPSQQAYGYRESQFTCTGPYQTSTIASATPNLSTLQAQPERHQTAIDPPNIDRGFLHPHYTNPFRLMQTNSEDGHTASASFPPVDKSCLMCDAKFSGKYRASNLARHKRIQHNGGAIFSCLEPTCDKVFKRQDARLKHVRKLHPGLVNDAVPRPEQRKGFKNAGITPV